PGTVADVSHTTTEPPSALPATLKRPDVDHDAVLTFGVTGDLLNPGQIPTRRTSDPLSVDPNSGAYSYVQDTAKVEALAQGDIPTDSFTVTVTDDHGAQATQTFVVNLTGANDGPTLDAVTARSGAQVPPSSTAAPSGL